VIGSRSEIQTDYLKPPVSETVGTFGWREGVDQDADTFHDALEARSAAFRSSVLNLAKRRWLVSPLRMDEALTPLRAYGEYVRVVSQTVCQRRLTYGCFQAVISTVR
jgi:hypothetical protein